MKITWASASLSYASFVSRESDKTKIISPLHDLEVKTSDIENTSPVVYQPVRSLIKKKA